jgi:hypothetical protein
MVSNVLIWSNMFRLAFNPLGAMYTIPFTILVSNTRVQGTPCRNQLGIVGCGQRLELGLELP